MNSLVGHSQEKLIRVKMNSCHCYRGYLAAATAKVDENEEEEDSHQDLTRRVTHIQSNTINGNTEDNDDTECEDNDEATQRDPSN